MIKQDFILGELGVLALDMGTLVSQERKLLEEEKERLQNRQSGEPIAVAPHNPNKFRPEILYFQRRLEAIRIYLTGDVEVEL